MSKYSKAHFENPYLDEAARKVTAELVMEEARQKWRAGSWRAKPDSFDIQREVLAEEGTAVPFERPAAERFQLDVKRDLMGETISLASLKELDYSPSYRPKGKLDIADEYTFGPMSTLQRYDVLAGELEAPPDDLSFLSDAQARLRREMERKKEPRDGKLRRDSRRLHESVDKRRSEVIRMIPEEEHDRADDIIMEARRRKEIEDRELGKMPVKPPKKSKKPYRKVVITADDPIEAAHARIVDSRLDRLPEQVGLGDGTQELPEFASETRRWSEIKSENPTWSELAAHTDVTIPKDDEPRQDSRARFISDDLFSPRHRYARVSEPRTRLRADGSLPFENEYLQKDNIDPHRVREIMEKQYHGRWIPPEYFNDDELVNEWFNRYNRGALAGEDYVSWAYRQRMMALEQQEQQEQQVAERVRMQQQQRETSARRHSPYSQYDGGYEPRRSDRDEERYEQARQQGYRQGRQMRKQERPDTRQQPQPTPPPMPGQFPPGYPPGYMPPGYPMPGYPPVQQGAQSQPQGVPPMPYGGQFPPYGYPYGGYPQGGQPGQPPRGAEPGAGGGGYSGMYPDLFAGDRSGAAPRQTAQQMHADMQRQIDEQLRQSDSRSEDMRPPNTFKRGRH